MNVIGRQMLCFVVSLQCLVFPLVNANQSQSGSCFSSSFSRTIGYILRGFLLGETEVSSVIECKKRCVVSANCLSLNILTNSDGSFVCQLNSDRKENGVKEQFVQHGAGEYYSLKVCRLLYPSCQKFQIIKKYIKCFVRNKRLLTSNSSTVFCYHSNSKHL